MIGKGRVDRFWHHPDDPFSPGSFIQGYLQWEELGLLVATELVVLQTCYKEQHYLEVLDFFYVHG